MALLNNMYIHVVEEKVSENTEISAHPLEEGADITDHVKTIPYTVSLSGYIVGVDAWPTIKAIRSLIKSGKLIKYSGRNIFANCVIKSFETEHPKEVWGGASFSMVIQEIRVAKSPYVPGSAVSQQVTTPDQSKSDAPAEKHHTVKSGDTLWGIAKSYYGNGAQSSKIYDANRGTISNPNVIQVGWKLLIP